MQWEFSLPLTSNPVNTCWFRLTIFYICIFICLDIFLYMYENTDLVVILYTYLQKWSLKQAARGEGCWVVEFIPSGSKESLEKTGWKRVCVVAVQTGSWCMEPKWSKRAVAKAGRKAEMLRIWPTWTKMCYWKRQSLYGLEFPLLFPPLPPVCFLAQTVWACKWRLATLPDEQKSLLLSQAVPLLNSLWSE